MCEWGNGAHAGMKTARRSSFAPAAHYTQTTTALLEPQLSQERRKPAIVSQRIEAGIDLE